MTARHDDASVDASGASDQWPAVVARGLTKAFRGRLAADRVDLDVPAGAFCGVVGPNGSGKTTTLRMVAGLLRPDEGRAWIAGRDVWADPVGARRLLGVVADPLNLFDRLTARELLAHVGDLRLLSPTDIERRSEDLLTVMDLTDAADEQIGGYSHGMRKKTAIASAMLHRPRVLLLDEPFEGVDPLSAVTVRSILDRYRRSGGTVVISSHAMDLVERMCDWVAVMAKGRLLALGPTASLRAGGRLEDVFIEMVGGSGGTEVSLDWLDELRS